MKTKFEYYVTLFLKDEKHRLDLLLDLCDTEQTEIEIDFENGLIYINEKNNIISQLEWYDFLESPDWKKDWF